MKRVLFAGLALLLLVAGVAVVQAAEGPSPVTITAVEYAFEAPDQLDAGPVAITFRNGGNEPHNLKVWQFKPGKTAEDLKAIRDPAELDSVLADALGGVSMTFPGTDQNVVLDLPAGQYFLVSATRASADGVTDFAKGLLKPLNVVARPSRAPIEEPAADIVVDLMDTAIEVPSQLEPGTHTIQITNSGTVPHQLIILKLLPGKTPEEFAVAFQANQTGQVVDPNGPNGGTAEFSPGRRGWISGTFPMGTYVAFDDFYRSAIRDMPFAFTVDSAIDEGVD